MTCATATFPEASPFDGRVVGGVVLGLGTVAATFVMAAFATLAAAWIVAASLSTNPYIRARVPTGPETIALNYRHPTLASAVDVSASASDPLDATPEAGPAATSASTPTNTAPVLTTPPLERANDVLSSPLPSTSPRFHTTHEIEDVADSTANAKSTPAAAPSSAPASSTSVSPMRASEPAKRAQLRPQIAAPPLPPPPSTSQKPVPMRQARSESNVPAPDHHTAVYDIAAHTVYLPDGDKLEAHSGLGKRLDDPRFVGERNRGPTPPNVYDLVLRGQLFHGVRAIRLNPVNEDNMFGRDGMLAHTYMLGPTGQSFGCVSFKNYHAFLQAFLDGEIDRLVVVPHLGTAVPHPIPSRNGRADRSATNHV